ncbi:hypothetical protein EJB05_16008, partial [Eragrostis curvula]
MPPPSPSQPDASFPSSLPDTGDPGHNAGHHGLHAGEDQDAAATTPPLAAASFPDAARLLTVQMQHGTCTICLHRCCVVRPGARLPICLPPALIVQPMPGSAGSNAGAGAAPVQDMDLSAAKSVADPGHEAWCT